MITGLYTAQADSIPILCITGQAPRAKLYKEDFQAVDIETIAKPVTKWAVCVREPALLPMVFQQAFHVMRSGRPGAGADRHADRRADGRDRVRHRHVRAVARLQAGRHASPGGAGHPDAQRVRPPADRLRWRRHQRRRKPALGGVRRTDGHPGDPDADGLGQHPGRPRVDGRHGGAADQPPVRQCDFARLGLRPWHRQPLGQPSHRLGRGLHQRPQIRPRRYRADADRACLRAGFRHRIRCRRGAGHVHRGGARDEGGGHAARPWRLGGLLHCTARRTCSGAAISMRCR